MIPPLDRLVSAEFLRPVGTDLHDLDCDGHGPDRCEECEDGTGLCEDCQRLTEAMEALQANPPVAILDGLMRRAVE